MLRRIFRQGFNSWNFYHCNIDENTVKAVLDAIATNGMKEAGYEYLLRGILMSTWGFLPAVFRPFWTVFPGLGAGFLNLGGKTEGTAKKRGKTGKNGREMA